MSEFAPASRPGLLEAWWLAARPRTLTAAVAPVAVGTALAIRDSRFESLPAVAAALGALAIQMGANFANDVADFRRGADTARIGPLRVTQAGLMSPRQVEAGMWSAFALAALAGLYLWAAAGWEVIAIGVASIIAAIAYTGGPWPYGYRALGEIFTFAFFGVVAVCGTYFVQAETLSWEVLAASLPVGCTVTAILVVNNVRDIDTDRAAGKRTLAVLLGRERARAFFVAVLAAAYVSSLGLWILGDFPVWVLLTLLSVPLATAPAATVLRRIEGPPLNLALAGVARLHLVFAVLLSVGIAL